MTHESSSRPILVAVVLLVIALILYPLSTGPATFLVDRGLINEPAAMRFYYPLRIICDACPPLSSALSYYISFFERPVPNLVPRG